MPERHFLTIALLVCALFLRMAVPTGWMPAQGAGAFAIEPCPAAGPAPMMHMAASDHGKTGHGPSATQHNGDCAFQPFSAGLADMTSAVVVPIGAPTAAALFDEPAASFFAAGPPALPPPSTGPPAIA